MLSAFVLAAAAVAAPPASDPAWESYACEGGPPVRLALIGGRPAERGFLALETGIVALERHEGDPPAVLRGEGHMVRASNWLDILYAPPGQEHAALQCRVDGAASPPPRPSPE